MEYIGTTLGLHGINVVNVKKISGIKMALNSSLAHFMAGQGGGIICVVIVPQT